MVVRFGRMLASCKPATAILLFIVVHIQATPGASTFFSEMPTSIVGTLQQNVTFRCISTSNQAIGWRFNDSFIPIAQQPPGIATETIGSLELLHVLCTEEYNNTFVECVVFVDDEQHCSEPALLQVQGVLDSVSDLTITQSNTSIVLSWTPPFSLDITGMDPDLTHCVTVYNASSTSEEPMAIHNSCNIVNPTFSFSVAEPNPADLYEFVVISVNGAGNGKCSETVQGFFLGKPIVLDVQDMVVSISTDSFQINISISEHAVNNSRGQRPTAYNVIIVDDNGQVLCRHQDPPTAQVNGWIVLVLNISSPSCLPAGDQNYSIAVEAVNEYGISLSSGSVQLGIDLAQPTPTLYLLEPLDDRTQFLAAIVIAGAAGFAGVMLVIVTMFTAIILFWRYKVKTSKRDASIKADNVELNKCEAYEFFALKKSKVRTEHNPAYGVVSSRSNQRL